RLTDGEAEPGQREESIVAMRREPAAVADPALKGWAKVIPPLRGDRCVGDSPTVRQSRGNARSQSSQCDENRRGDTDPASKGWATFIPPLRGDRCVGGSPGRHCD